MKSVHLVRDRLRALLQAQVVSREAGVAWLLVHDAGGMRDQHDPHCAVVAKEVAAVEQFAPDGTASMYPLP